MYKTIDRFVRDIVSLNETKRNEQTNGILCKNGGGTILMF